MGNTILENHEWDKVNLVTQANMMDTWKCALCNKKVEARMGPPAEECPKNMISLSTLEWRDGTIIEKPPLDKKYGLEEGVGVRVAENPKGYPKYLTVTVIGGEVIYLHEREVAIQEDPIEKALDLTGGEIIDVVDLTGGEIIDVVDLEDGRVEITEELPVGPDKPFAVVGDFSEPSEEASITEDHKPIPRPPTDPVREELDKEELVVKEELDKEELVVKEEVDKEELVKVDYPDPPADRHYEEFAHIESWDEVVSEAADLRVEMDNKKFRLGALVNFSCPRKAGRPAGDDDRWNVSSLAASIGEDRAVLSQLASNEEFWNKDIREELPPQVSWRQLARVRVDSGWRPGKPVGTEQLQFALDGIIKIADGIYERPPKKVQKVKPERYAKRIIKTANDAKKRMFNTPDEDFGEIVDLFQTIVDSAEDIIDMLKESDEEQ